LAQLKARILYLEDLDAKKWAHWIGADWDKLAPFAGRIWSLVQQALAEGDSQRVDLVWKGAWIACRAQELGLDRLHAHFATLPSSLAHMASRVSGLPYSFTAHAKDIFVYTPEETRLGELIEYADFMVTVTDFNRRHLLQILPGVDADKIKMIHNGIDLQSFRPTPFVDRDEHHILAVGRQVPKKGFGDLLTACAQIRERGVAFHLTIAGGGPEAAELERRRGELGLTDLVSFTGPVKVDRVRELMGRASVFALPCCVAPDNNVDALPTVLLESLASGLPAVSTSLSGIPEIISDEVEGRLVPPNNPEALGEALEQLLVSASHRRDCGERGREKATADFDIRRNVERLLDLFRSGGRRSTPTDAATAPRRVLYVCTDRGIAYGGTKGAAIHVREFLAALLAAGVRPSAVVRRRSRRSKGQHQYPVHVLSAELASPPFAAPAITEGHEYALNVGFVAQMQELHREVPFGGVYERYSVLGTAGREFARSNGLPYVLEVNAPLVEEAKTHRGLQLENLANEIAEHLFTTADHVVAVSAAVRDYILEMAPGARVTVVPNGVATDRIRPGLATPAWRERIGGSSAEDFVVGFVGRVRPWHGVDVLIDAAAEARAADSSVRLCVVGNHDGLGTELQDRCRRRGLADAAVFTGAVAPDDVPAALGAMDVVVAPYPQLDKFYFSPLKIFEYMAAGKPIVASAIGQIVDIIEHERTGLLVPAGDAAALAAALLRLRQDPQLAARLGKNAREEAEARHTWRDRVSTVEDIFAGIRRQRSAVAS